MLKDKSSNNVEYEHFNASLAILTSSNRLKDRLKDKG